MRLLLLVVLAAPAARAHSSAVAGTSAAPFLKLGVGAGPAAMSGAQAALSEDVYSLYWNPAGLSRITGRGEAAFFHDRWFGMMDHQFVGAAASIPAWDAVGAVGVTRLGTTQRGYDAADNATGEFATSDIALSAAVARRFEAFPGRDFEEERLVRAGLAFKLIRQSVPGAASSTFALDGGLQGSPRETGRGAWLLGFAFANLGRPAGLGSGRSPLPRTLRLGTAYRLNAPRVSFAADLVLPADDDPQVLLGTEWRPLAGLRFRAGYRPGKPAEGLLDALTFGGGVAVKAVEISGAFVGHPDLGTSALFDVKFRW
ncbi:MAG: PorV/PorQ family protein [Elusimicrobia bacterium]|nr:PorV/PorQ family protein [Elusimicrobiota bacterium]